MNWTPILRGLTQALVTSGFITATQETFDGTLRRLWSQLMSEEGLTLEEAKAVALKFLQDMATNTVAVFVALRTGAPTTVAERFGLTSKGFKNPILSTRGASVLNKLKTGAISTTPQVAISTVTEADTLIKVAKASTKGFKQAADFLTGKLNTIFLGFLVVSGFIDFGNWETGAYSKTFQKIFEVVTFGLLKPDEDYRKTKTASPEVFEKVYNTYKLEGAYLISDPYKMQSVLFSRDALIDLVDKVGAHLLATTGKASTKEVLLATQTLVIFKETKEAISTTAKTSTSTTTPTVKVYTGIVSAGKLGSTIEFVPRQDDLIESEEELRTAATNNLAPFLASLPGKIIYEIKIVSSVTTSDGFKKSGISQQIQTGTFANGQPKFKTVTNKFATLSMYILTDKNTRSRISTIVLGPTDSAKLNITQNGLVDIENDIKKSVVTTDTKEIETIQHNDGTTVKTVAQTPTETTVLVPDQTFIYDGYRGSITLAGEAILELRYKIASGELSIENAMEILKKYHQNGGKFSWKNSNPNVVIVAFVVGKQFIVNILTTKDTTPVSVSVVSQPTAIPVTDTQQTTPIVPFAPAKTQIPSAALLATTLSAYYVAIGQPLPSVAVRAKLYADLGLGQEAYYTGTAEQNTKLLSKLKSG